jgi:hypothetical protein
LCGGDSSLLVRALTPPLPSPFSLPSPPPQVGNCAFSERYRETQPIVLAKVDAVQATLLQAAAAMEAEFTALYASDPDAAVEYMTSFMEGTGEQLMQEWTQFWMFLFATFRDGDMLSASTGVQCPPGQTGPAGCTAKLLPNVNETGVHRGLARAHRRGLGQREALPRPRRRGQRGGPEPHHPLFPRHPRGSQGGRRIREAQGAQGDPGGARAHGGGGK